MKRREREKEKSGEDRREGTEREEGDEAAGTMRSQAGHSKMNTEMRNVPPSGVKTKKKKEKLVGSEDKGQFGPLGISYSGEASLSWKP